MCLWQTEVLEQWVHGFVVYLLLVLCFLLSARKREKKREKKRETKRETKREREEERRRVTILVQVGCNTLGLSLRSRVPTHRSMVSRHLLVSTASSGWSGVSYGWTCGLRSIEAVGRSPPRLAGGAEPSERRNPSLNIGYQQPLPSHFGEEGRAKQDSPRPLACWSRSPNFMATRTYQNCWRCNGALRQERAETKQAKLLSTTTRESLTQLAH